MIVAQQFPAPFPPQPEVHLAPITIAVDTREQQPFSFQGIVLGKTQYLVKQVRKGLPTGDSLDGYEDRIVVERKSSEDLINSCVAGHERFEREHERMMEILWNNDQPGLAGNGFACVVCEGSLADIYDGLMTEGRWRQAETLLGTAASWGQKYGVPWLFAGTRRMAEVLTFRVLLKWWKENCS